MNSFLAFIFIIGVVIIVHELGHFIVAKSLKVRVEEFIIGFGPRIFKKKTKDTEYGISLIPLGGYVKLAGDSLAEFKGNSDEYLAKTPGERARIVFFGPLFNYILGFLCFWSILLIYPTPMLTNKVGGLIDGLGAKEAGIQTGDVIVSIDNKKIAYWEDIQDVIQTKPSNSTVDITVLRKKLTYNIKVKIKEHSPQDLLGQAVKVGMIGIKPSDKPVMLKLTFTQSLQRAAVKTWNLTILTYKAFWLMVTGKLSLRDSLAGPLGFYYITSKYAREGILAIIHLLGVLSLNLCIFNLLPIPVLDGGHIVLLGIEKLRNKPLSLRADNIISRVGFSLLITLAIIATSIDLMRLVGDKVFFKWLK
jgi:regulator of sigma E protease